MDNRTRVFLSESARWLRLAVVANYQRRQLVTRCTNLYPFTFTSVSLEVVKQQSFDKAARGGLGTRLWSWVSAACSISAGIERDGVELHDGSA